MRLVSALLISLLSFSTALAEVPDLAGGVTPEETKASCSLKFVPGERESQLIRESLLAVKAEQSWYGKSLATVFAKKIHKRVLAACTDPELCTPENILRVTDEETRQVFGNIRGVSGYFVLAGMQASVYAVMFQITKSTGGSIAATIIANSILGRFTDIFQSPLNFQVDPVVKRFAQNMVSRTDKATRVEKGINFRLVQKTQVAQEIYSGTERDGIGQLFGPQADQGNKLRMMQGYFSDLRSPASYTAEEQDQVARMIGIQLFEQRQYHAHLVPSDPEFNALFTPYVRPLAKIYRDTVIRDKIWGVLDLEETAFARQQKKEGYDRKAAQRYYEGLTYQWFERPMPVIVPRKTLLEE